MFLLGFGLVCVFFQIRSKCQSLKNNYFLEVSRFQSVIKFLDEAITFKFGVLKHRAKFLIYEVLDLRKSSYISIQPLILQQL